MATRFYDGFSHYASGDILEKWTSGSGTIASGQGRGGRNALQDPNCTITLDSQATWVVGFAYKVTAIVDKSLVYVKDNTTTQMDIYLNSSGKLSVRRGDGTVLGTSTNAISANVYAHIALKVTINNTTGSFELRINNVNETSGTGVDTQNSGNASADRFHFNPSSASNYYSDLYINDGTGATNNDFEGDCSVIWKTAEADGTYTAWTASTGADYQCVDDSTPNDDTDYISSSTATDKDTFGIAAVGISGAVKGVQVVFSARKDDAGSRSVRTLTRIAATDYNGDTQSISDNYKYYFQRYGVSPATSSAWTVSEVDGAEFGVELVS